MTPRPPAGVAYELHHASALDLGLVGPRGCHDCGRAVTVRCEGADTDPYITRDRVPDAVGDCTSSVLGHVTLCRGCLLDPVKAAARMRRRRATKRTGNFIGAEG